MDGENPFKLPGTNLTKAVATTASVLVSSTQTGSDTHSALRSNKAFKNAVKSTIDSNKNITMIQKRASDHSTLSSLFFRRKNHSFGTNHHETIKPKDFAQLPAELLEDIPDVLYEDSPEGFNNDGGHATGHRAISFSLYQGFTAVLPEIDEALEKLKSGNSNLLTYDDIDTKKHSEHGEPSHVLPKGITINKIKNSQSKRQLTSYKDEINYKLDLIEIRKGLAANEIHEIDSKIERLYAMRKQIFEKVTNYEQDESYLEDKLELIQDRLDFVEEMAIDDFDDDEESEYVNSDEDEDTVIINPAKLRNKQSESGNGESGSRLQSPGLEEGGVESDTGSGALLSKSIYGKLRNHSKRQQSQQRVPSRRHKPTLQQYYKPGSLIKEFKGHDNAITCFGFDEPYGTLVTASYDNTVRVWDLGRYKCSGLLEGHLSSVGTLQMNKNLVVTGSLDATLKLWDISKVDIHDEEAETPLLNSFESHVEEITSLCFDDRILVSGSADKTIRQWDLYTGQCLQTIDVLWASSMMSSHLNRVSSSTMDSYHDLNSWAHPSQNPQNPQQSLDYPFIGALQFYDAALATGTSDGIVRLWDLRSGEVIRQLFGHTGAVTALQFDDKNLTTGSADRSIRIWDLRTGGILDSFAYEAPIRSLQFDSTRIVCTDGERKTKIYDRIEGKHWTCGGDIDENDNESEIENNDFKFGVNYARYQEGYMVESRNNGTIGIWAI